MENFAGKILVAHPRKINDSFFSKSVVYITEDHTSGSVGLILNKPANFTLRNIMQDKGLDSDVDRMIFNGGPVNKTALVLLHDDDWYSSNTLVTSPGFAITSDNLMLEKISMNNTPRNFRFMAGVSGWAKGQLIQEIEKGNWLICHADKETVFNYEGEKQYRRAVELCSAEMMDQFF